MLEYFQIILIIQFIFSLILIKEFKNPNNVLILVVIYVYHIIFAYLNYSTPSDAQSMYQEESLHISLAKLPSIGNEVVIFIAKICNEYLHLSYLGATLIFASLSFIGFWMLLQVIQNHKIKYLWLILLIPSMHFWTAGFGKDCLVFFFITTLLYGVQKNKLYYILIAFIGIYLLRPHVAVLFGSIYLLSLLFSSHTSFQVKLIATLTALVSALLLTNHLLAFLNVDGLSDFYRFALMMQGQNLYGNSSYNVSEYNTFFQVFTYLFRPFFESLNLAYFVVSIDNLIYFSIFLWVIINIKLITFKDQKMFFLIMSFFIFSLIMGFTISNLGLALRQKIMIMPFLLLIFIELKSKKRNLLNY